MDWALAAAVGDRIRQLRESKKWKQSDLATRVGVSRAAIGYYETGTRTPPYATLIRIAEVFGVSTDYLLRGIDLTPLRVENLPEDQKIALQTIIAAMQRKS